MSKVYLVGAGPGDPELITVKGLRCIKEADVIIYDRLVNNELLSYAKPDVELIYCGKMPDSHTLQQETINHLLVKHAKKGKIVIRLKGGDPFVFGRGGEEAEFLSNNGVEYQIVPGISSGIAAPAYAGIPVTHRDYGSSFAIVTGHPKSGKVDQVKWEALAKGIDTIAVYMGVKNLPYIQEQLLMFGKHPDTPAALIQWGTLNKQHTVVSTLSEVDKAARLEKIENPCIIVIGEVVKLREKIKWFEDNKPNEQFLVSEAL